MPETSAKLGRVSVNPRGEYAGGETYDRLDIVQFGGSGWLCLKDGTTCTEPTAGENWMRFADNGGADTVKAAKESADAAKASEDAAKESRTAAAESASTAESAADRAEAAAGNVEEDVRQQLQGLVDDATAAKTGAGEARDQAEGHSTAAGEKAAEATQSAEEARKSAAEARESVTAAGEAADRAEEAASKAERIAGGDFATHADRPDRQAAAKHAGHLRLLLLTGRMPGLGVHLSEVHDQIRACVLDGAGGGAGRSAASLGYTGNEYTLDSEFGFPKFYCREDVWDPDKVLERLGSEWFFTQLHYKPYPVCRYLHSVLDAFLKLQDQYHFSPEEIAAVRCHTAAFVANPDQYSVANQVDVQFSGPYSVALAAFGYKPGPAWQDKIALNDKRLAAFARKVTMHVAPEYKELRANDPDSWYGRVEVDVRGKTYIESVDYSRGTNKEGYRLTDAEIEDRFRLGANCIIPDYKAERAIEIVQNLERETGLERLMENLVL